MKTSRFETHTPGFLAGISALALLLSGCAATGAGPAGGPPGGFALPVETLTLKPDTIQEASEYLGIVRSRQSVALMPRVSGPVSHIRVQVGQSVSAGMPLLDIEASEASERVQRYRAVAQSTQADVRKAEETLKAYQGELPARKSDVEFAESQARRYQALHEKKAVSDQEWETYTTRLAQARSALATLEANIRAQQAEIARTRQDVAEARANIGEQQAQLGYYTVRAPFAGVVGEIPVKVGDYVTPNTLLTTVTDRRQLEIDFSLPAERSAQVKPGLPVTLLTPEGEALGGGRVFFVAPTVDTAAQTVLVKARFDNRQGLLRADQQVRARMVWRERPGLRIPVTAVQHLNNKDFVFLVQPAQGKPGPSPWRAAQVPVALGDIEGNFYAVLQGLKPGQQIITGGIQKLADGAPVQLAGQGSR